MSNIRQARPHAANFITDTLSEIHQRDSGIVTVHLLRDVIEGVDEYCRAHRVSRDVAIGELLRGALGVAA